MVRGTHPRAARRAVCSQWCSDPDTSGAYSYLRIGGTPAHREVLGTEVLPRMWFAGEATSVEYPATRGLFLFPHSRVRRTFLSAAHLTPNWPWVYPDSWPLLFVTALDLTTFKIKVSVNG
jgi:hypothetical protein